MEISEFISDDVPVTTFSRLSWVVYLPWLPDYDQDSSYGDEGHRRFYDQLATELIRRGQALLDGNDAGEDFQLFQTTAEVFETVAAEYDLSEEEYCTGFVTRLWPMIYREFIDIADELVDWPTVVGQRLYTVLDRPIPSRAKSAQYR